MKRLLVLFVAFAFVFSGSVFAAEAIKAKKAAAAKETTMSATGKVTEISDTMLKIERTVKGKAEIMVFTLEKAYPASPNITAGDKVKVSYMTKDGNNVSTKITKVVKKVTNKPAKKKVAVKESTKPAEEKAAPVEAAPPVKK
jgi:hypothetical protein